MNYISTIQTSNCNTTYITEAYCYSNWSSYYNNKFDTILCNTTYLNEPLYISTIKR